MKHAKISLPIEQLAFWPQLEEIELETCRNYEFGRLTAYIEEICKRRLGIIDSDSDVFLKDRVIAIRRGWRLKEFTSTVPENPTWFQSPASRTLVLYPEWPDTPYLGIDLARRLQRIRELSASPTGEDHLRRLASLLSPLNSSTGEKYILPDLAIPKRETHERLVQAFHALLKIKYPAQGRKHYGKYRYARAQGRGSAQATCIDDLNALAAHWLCKEARLVRAQVIALIKYPKGHPYAGAPVYGGEKQLDKPLRRIADRLQRFREEVLGHLYTLTP